MSKFDFSQKYQRNPDLVSTDMDGDTVMMSIERGEYFGLGGVGSTIYNLLETPITPHEIVNNICTEFYVDEDTCNKDVQNFMNDLLTHKIIVHA